MVINKPIRTTDDFIDTLNQATKQITTLEQNYKSKKKLDIDLEDLQSALESCNQSIQDKKVTLDPKTQASVDAYLQAMQSFDFIKTEVVKPKQPDKSTQEKTAGLVAAFNEAVRLENNIKSNIKNWKIGRRVEGSNQSSPSR